MYCSNCRAEIPDGSKICPKCGAPIEQGDATNIVKTVQAPKSIGGFVCGLLGFLSEWIPFVGLILSIVGVALCSSGWKEVNRNPGLYTGTKLLTVGKILGIIGIVAGSFVFIFTLIYGIILGGGFFAMVDLLLG